MAPIDHRYWNFKALLWSQLHGLYRQIECNLNYLCLRHGRCMPPCRVSGLAQCRGNHAVFLMKCFSSCLNFLNPSDPMSNSSHDQSCFFIKFKEAFLKASRHLTVSYQEHVAARCFNANNYLSFYKNCWCCPLSNGSVAPTANDGEYSRVALKQWLFQYEKNTYKENKSRNYFLTAPLLRRTKNLCYIKLGFEFRLDIHV